MEEVFVDCESLNVRSSPTASADNILGKIYLTQQVSLIGTEPDGWAKCRVLLGDRRVTGYVAERYLRKRLSPNREALISSVRREYFRFDRGMGKEHIFPYSKYVGEMWKAIGLPKLDGTNRDLPWSAAAISFMVRRSGSAYRNFRFASAHSYFIHHAITARKNGDTTVPFWGVRLSEAKPEVGDIVARDNPEYGPTVDYDVAASLESYRSHTDIVVSIDSANNRLLAIGGNVSHSVSIATYDLAPGDYLASTKSTFALLKNITDASPLIA
jgi:hypothetical protein